MESNIVIITEEQLNIFIEKGVKDFYNLGLKFLHWKTPYVMQVVDKKKWMLSKIRYGI